MEYSAKKSNNEKYSKADGDHNGNNMKMLINFNSKLKIHFDIQSNNFSKIGNT
jgi:hypothetical protein